MAKDPTDRIDKPCLAYQRMLPVWDKLRDLLGGTAAMRAAGNRHLPKHAKEEDWQYRFRLENSFLYAAFADTIDRLVSKPFSQPTTTKGAFPERLAPIVKNADRSGRDLTAFAADVFRTALVHGLTHILVDYPQMAPAATLADERAADARPMFLHIAPRNLIGWRSATLANGQQRLTEIRIKETHVKPQGRWGETEVECIRLYTETEWALYQPNAKGDDYEIVEQGAHTFGGVPLVTFYTKRTGFMEAEPPLEALADLNIAHWQSWSDQRNALRFARIGMIKAIGLSDEDIAKIVIRPGGVIASGNEKAQVGYLEPTGQAMEIGERDLEKLEERMEVLGLQPLIERTAASTATGKVLDENKSESKIQSWIRGEEGAFEECFSMAGRWTGDTLPDDFAVDIFSDFGITSRDGADLSFLLQACVAGKLTDKTFLAEVKRRGTLSDAINIETEADDLQRQGPALGLMTDNNDGGGNGSGDNPSA